MASKFMRLILGEQDLYALQKRVEDRFAIRMGNHESEMRGGSYLRWPRTRIPLTERLNPMARAEAVPPFSTLLIFRNGEECDPDDEPFVDGYSTSDFLVELEHAEDDAVGWFVSSEGAVVVKSHD